MTLAIVVTLTAALALAATAGAQEPGEQERGRRDYGPPTFGLVELATSFQPDPYRIDVHEAGGVVPAQQLTGQDACRGYIYPNPDYVLNYSAGSQDALTIYAVAEADTTLVILQPGGSWACDDDTRGQDPLVRLPRPGSGAYHIWVGLKSRPLPGQRLPLAGLFISERGPAWQ